MLSWHRGSAHLHKYMLHAHTPRQNTNRVGGIVAVAVSSLQVEAWIDALSYETPAVVVRTRKSDLFGKPNSLG